MPVPSSAGPSPSGPGLRVTASAPGRRAPNASSHDASSGAITRFDLDDPRPTPWWYPPTLDVRFGAKW
ncbi:hypothetical protein GCM10010106_30220 [Thermopolyspora flexuosa]|nr:hypothetical protein GCM10010106_30220 [Thermopolyspora flexuosa]